MSCLLGRNFRFRSSVENQHYFFTVIWNETIDKVYVKDIETPLGHAGFSVPVPESVIRDMYLAVAMVRNDIFADSYTGVPQISGSCPGPGFICL